MSSSPPSSASSSPPVPKPSGTHNPQEADFLPSPEDLKSALEVEIVDQDNRSLTLGELVKGKRVVLIFIRHFWCTNCQVYTHQLGLSIPPKNLPQGTEVAIIGCGSSVPIKTYTSFTSSPYSVYSCPSLELHKIFRFVRTLQSANPSSSNSNSSSSSTSANKNDPKKTSTDEHSPGTCSDSPADGSCSTSTSTSTGYLDGVGSETKRVWLSFKNGPFKNFGHYSTGVRGPNDQNGGEMIIEPDGTCSLMHRMQNTADHISLEDLAKAIGAKYVPLSEADKKWPG
ncbi:hypothetical protein IAU59_005761 [Kwoniella sp. CBS 9459]